MQIAGAALTMRFTLALVLFVLLSSGLLRAQQHIEGKETTFPCAGNAVRLSSEELSTLVIKRAPVENRMIDGAAMHGTVAVAVCIGKNGRLRSAKILSGHPIAWSAVLFMGQYGPTRTGSGGIDGIYGNVYCVTYEAQCVALLRSPLAAPICTDRNRPTCAFAESP
jgi:hypothetical protein